jgi:glycosyltransferase involved in cell wall biosynthesis
MVHGRTFSGKVQEAEISVILRKEVHKRLSRIKETDILVGIPSYNNARTIGHVVRAVQVGIAKYFPEKRAVIVNSDGGSNDLTTEVVNNCCVKDFDSLLVPQRVNSIEKIVTPYHGIPGKGSAFRTVFEIAKELNARACAVVDSDLRSITPEWMDLLLRPVLERGYDFVAPYYLRHKYDGTITNSIVYPLTRALYGLSIRQPIGGDFGFSGEMARFYLTKDVWESDIARFGIDIWMTTTAIANGFKVCQSFLGAKIHDAKDPGTDLSAMLHQVVSAVFELMEAYQDAWKGVRNTRTPELFGFRYDVGLEPIHVDIERMIDKFMLGVKELGPIWEGFIPGNVLGLLRGISPRPWQSFRLPIDVWVEIIYSFAIAAHRRILNREHLLKSLTPLYLGRVASFIVETLNSSAGEVEAIIEESCRMFEEKKDFLINNWA